MEYSYYGRIDHSIVPNKKAAHFMLDEHIKNSVDKEIKRFNREIKLMIKEVKITLKKDSDSMKRKIVLLETQLKEAKSKLHVLEFPTE